MGPKGSRWQWPEYRQAFEKDLRRLHDGTGPWDLVFISGDLTQTGSQREFNFLTSALESFWVYLRSLGSDPVLLAVPGNHDLHRDSLSSMHRNMLEARRWHESSVVRSDFWSRRDNTLRQAVHQAFAPFSSWLESWQNNHLSALSLEVHKGLLPGDFAATVVKEGLRLGIAGLNSAFLLPNASGTQAYFDIDSRQLEEATGGNLHKWALTHDLNLLLTHHPPTSLERGSLTLIQEELASRNDAVLHLCGSRHAADDPARPGAAMVFQAASLFGGEPDLTPQGYMAGRLELGQVSQVQVYPRTVVTSRAGPALTGGPDSIILLSRKERPGPATPTPAAFRSDPGPDQAQTSRPEPPAGLRPRTTLNLQEKVNRMAWAPSGKELALGLASGTVSCWAPGATRPRWTEKAHQTPVVDVCFAPDGKQLATRSALNVRFWNAEKGGASIHTIGPLRVDGLCLAWSSQGVLAAGSDDGTLQLWSSENARPSTGKTYRVQLPTDSLAWSPDGRTLACAGEGRGQIALLDIQAGKVLSVQERAPLQLGSDFVLDLAWQPGSSRLAAACRDNTLWIFDADNPKQVRTLEGHTDAVASVSFSRDGRLLASRSRDGKLYVHNTKTWDLVASLDVFSDLSAPEGAGIAFSPTEDVLALIGTNSQTVELWDVDVDTLLGQPKPPRTVHSVSAKVVLVGEGRVGKSSLALRLVEDRYEELDSTHAMRTWFLPQERLDPQAHVPDNERRELVLWDMGGQDEYRLVHQLFFRDTATALLVMEPGHGQRALDEIEGWNQRLSAQADSSRPMRKLLVGSKVDNEQAPVDRPGIERFLRQSNFEPDAYVSTSAKTGRGIPELQALLARAIDWSSLGRSSHPELFERIRQYLKGMRENGQVVITLPDLELKLRATSPEVADPEALRAVVEQLGRQGLLADTRLADGTQALVLEIEQVERYANSLVVAARDNPNHVPAVDMTVFSRAQTLPRILPQERLRRDQELMVLDCVVELLLQHGICLQHQGLLVFPSLFLLAPPDPGPGTLLAVTRTYEVSGPIDNIYASLVTAIAMSRGFGPMRLWRDRAEFGEPDQDSSGIRKTQSPEQKARGSARLEVYFDASTPEAKRKLFAKFIDTHLGDAKVTFDVELSVTCIHCREYVFAPKTVLKRLAQGEKDVFCPECDRYTPLTPGDAEAELSNKVRGLRNDMRQQRTQSVQDTKGSMKEAQTVESQDTPIRILHLSDLHVGAGADPITLFQPLIADLRDTSDLAVDRLDYLVISGDITNRAEPTEFKKALEFVSALREEFGLSAERCIIVPGNHDLDWTTRVYDWRGKNQVDMKKLAPGSYKQQGDIYLLREEDKKYAERFRNFSQDFHHPLLLKDYPLDAEQQCISILSTDTRLQFLAMNSSWEVDEYFPERAHIHDGALSRGLMAAQKQLDMERQAGRLSADAQVLKLAVWHHPITGNEKMQRDAFMTRLRQAGVRIVLHGHVHETRADVVGYTDHSRQIHVIGAGSFGAPTYHRPESVPRLYNLLEVARDHSRIRVKTRALKQAGGAWGPWPEWRDPRKGSDAWLPYYDLKLR
jgi:small GTP-binding protein